MMMSDMDKSEEVMKKDDIGMFNSQLDHVAVTEDAQQLVIQRKRFRCARAESSHPDATFVEAQS